MDATQMGYFTSTASSEVNSNIFYVNSPKFNKWLVIAWEIGV